MALAAKRVDGGIRMSGRWSYASGSAHATWATCSAVLTDDAGRPVDGALCFVPAAEVRLEDTWHTVGMRGTGSHTWVLEDVFVPEDRMVYMSTLAEGKWPVPSGEPMYRMPFVPLASLPLVGPGLGLGRAALRLAVEKAPTKPIHHTFFERQSDSVGVQIQIAEAALKLKTARLHAYDVADELDRAVADNEEPDYTARAEMRAEFGLIARQVVEAIQLLVDVHGAGSFAELNRMQQFWRDANTAARHAALNAAVGYEIFGKALLGVQDRISPTV
jgi:3-hydroxy-9,10-secoandrosta-1,3,5(10)-triene-9,17-dione monooxygenase